ncbi:30S ribosomal protein S8 [Candidatus Gottesmanbacteria bacterium]|nr:30S ribosomal protein S8 [Candidatus Gottesmanbacteria bacterium]
MTNDIVGDTLIRIKNGYLAGKKQVELPYSKIGKSLVKLLAKNKYLTSVEIIENNNIKTMLVKLAYNDKTPVVSDVTRVSKPSYRVYVKTGKIPNVFSGLGVTIVSTPQGLMTGKEARKKRLGGELLCKIW